MRKIVKAKKREALVLMTLYSPFMWAGHSATFPVLLRHMEEDPDAVKRGLDTLVESQLIFVRACIDAGVDGFYMSTQGSETGQFSNPSLFRNYVKPSDLVAMREASSRCPFNIVHVCDYNGPYSNYDAVLDYPGQVVSCCPRLTERTLSWQQVSALFKRPGMGGMERKGTIYSGEPGGDPERGAKRGGLRTQAIHIGCRLHGSRGHGLGQDPDSHRRRPSHVVACPGMKVSLLT